MRNLFRHFSQRVQCIFDIYIKDNNFIRYYNGVLQKCAYYCH